MTFDEVISFALKLSVEERQRLVLFLLQSLREEGQLLPEPRQFTLAEMEAWMTEDALDNPRRTDH